MPFELDGLEQIQDQLEGIQLADANLDGVHQISLTELFNPRFMQRYTEFESIKAFFDDSPWTVDSKEDLEAIPEAELDAYVDAHSECHDADELLNNATKEWVARQLGF